MFFLTLEQMFWNQQTVFDCPLFWCTFIANSTKKFKILSNVFELLLHRKCQIFSFKHPPLFYFGLPAIMRNREISIFVAIYFYHILNLYSNNIVGKPMRKKILDQNSHQIDRIFVIKIFEGHILIKIRLLMKNPLQIQKIQEIPPHLRRLITKPQPNKVPFSQLNDNNAQKAVNYIKTKTMLDLLSPPSLQRNQTIKSDNAIILVFCQPSEELCIQKNEVFPYTPISYPNWLQAVGAQCIPIPYNINEGSMQFLLQRSHGLLIPGGASNLYKSYENKEGYGQMTAGFLKIWRAIQKLWAKGINYPIWGTCLGLQVMLIAISNDIKILSNLNHRGYQAEIYSDYQNSTILSSMPHNLRLNLQHRKLINFYHMHGISVKKFQNSPKLTQKLKITSISKDKDGKWFCSLLQGKDKPIFLSQFHAEKQAFQWTKKGDILANKQSVQISHFIAQSFVRECLKCKKQKSFASTLQLQFYTFQQYRQIFTPQKHYRVYAIDFKFRDYDRQHKKKITEKQISSSKKIFL